eukprot:2401495-Prymnesium_polylepis.1
MARTPKAAAAIVLAAAAFTEAAGNCEPWCENACGDLNGDTRIECGGCDERHRCRPGAEGFGAPPQARGTGGVGMGQSANPGNEPDVCNWDADPDGCAAQQEALQEALASGE